MYKKRSHSDDEKQEPAKKWFRLSKNCEAPEPMAQDEAYQKFCSNPNTVTEPPPISAFARGYELETMLDVFMKSNEQLFFLIKFKNLAQPELVPYAEVHRNASELVRPFCAEYSMYWQAHQFQTK